LRDQTSGLDAEEERLRHNSISKLDWTLAAALPRAWVHGSVALYEHQKAKQAIDFGDMDVFCSTQDTTDAEFRTGTRRACRQLGGYLTKRDLGPVELRPTEYWRRLHSLRKCVLPPTLFGIPEISFSHTTRTPADHVANMQYPSQVAFSVAQWPNKRQWLVGTGAQENLETKTVPHEVWLRMEPRIQRKFTARGFTSAPLGGHLATVRAASQQGKPSCG
jgi:hypothetical protein